MSDRNWTKSVQDNLLKRRSQLRGMLREQMSMSWQEHSIGDFADDAAESEQTAVDSWLTDAEHRELGLIQEALAKVANGQYGLCEECGGKIGRERLKYLPYAALCVACQRSDEVSP